MADALEVFSAQVDIQLPSPFKGLRFNTFNRDGDVQALLHGSGNIPDQVWGLKNRGAEETIIRNCRIRAATININFRVWLVGCKGRGLGHEVGVRYADFQDDGVLEWLIGETELEVT